MHRALKPAVVAILLIACSKPLPNLDGMDLEKWKEDKRGCLGQRAAMEPVLGKELEKLKGLAEMDVIALLGRPDENELYKRNQKFYNYFITPGPDCPDHQPIPAKLVIRFNAMGYAQMVSIEAP